LFQKLKFWNSLNYFRHIYKHGFFIVPPMARRRPLAPLYGLGQGPEPHHPAPAVGPVPLAVVGEGRGQQLFRPFLPRRRVDTGAAGSCFLLELFKNLSF
jgi:hypothetical protein